MTELKHTNNGRESVPHPPEKEGGVLRIHNQIGAVVAAIIIASFAAFAGSASAQQPQLPPPQSTYEDPLPFRVADDRFQSLARNVVRECVDTSTTGRYEVRRPLTDRCIELILAQDGLAC